MPLDPARAKSLFLAASDLADPARRAAFLDRECGADAELRERVEALLRADEARAAPSHDLSDATGALEPETPPSKYDATGDFGTGDFGPDGATGTFDGTPKVHVERSAPIGLGSVIAGRYTLVEVIGEGGMGAVYLTDQSEPVKRQVALKLIKSGMDSKTVLARFDAERQALALMDHPNIARVYDGGTTGAGQPFFVMELVQGVPITEYCDRGRLSLDARLQLFVQVCHAVQHAHQKGIIHRDLKPGNVLVTEVDGRPTPKVIDFGVAKATEVKLTDMSFSDVGAIVGTPAYMSPEQADPTSMDIDTRTDVYALGVMLYELLTGSPPIDGKQFKRGAVLEMLRMVREVEPPRPSTRLSTADALPNIAANRSVDPTKLAKLLQGELDWVVMKALEKDRTRRYETANGLARDLQRYLADEVVEARPPSRSYRLKKFVRRHKGQVVAASLVALSLLVGIVGTTFGWVEAREQKRLADQRAEGERLAKLDAQENERLAVTAAEKERQATELTAARLNQIELINGTVFDIFAELDMRKVKKGDKPVEAVLAQKLVEAGRKLDARAIHDPLVLARLRHQLGITLANLGQAAAAIELLQSAVEARKATLGPDHPDTLRSMHVLARGYIDAGKLDSGLPLYEETLKLRKAKLGPDHPDTLDTMSDLAAAYHTVGRLEESLRLHTETLKLRMANLPRGHTDILESTNSLALGLIAAGEPEKAVPLLESTLKIMKARFGPDHPDTLVTQNNLASGYAHSGNLDKALPLYEETLRLQKAKLGPDHPETITSMNDLAVGYKTAGKLDKSLPLSEAAFSLAKAKLGADHPDTLTMMSNLAMDYLLAGKEDKALPILEESLALTKAKLGAGHPNTLTMMNNLAGLYWKAKRLDLSIRLFEEALKQKEAKLGRKHSDTLHTLANLGVNLKDAGRLKEAIPLLEEAYRESKKHAGLGFVPPQLLDAYSKAGEADKFAGVWPDARNALPKDGPGLAAHLTEFGLAFLRAKKWAAAGPLFRESLAVREKSQPDDWRTFQTQSLLGMVIMAQKKEAEAEPLLLAAYAGLKQREKSIPPGETPIANVLDLLIALYTVTNKPEEVKKWQAERAKYPAPPAVRERSDKGESGAAPFTDADARRIAALPPAEQIEEVRKELTKRNREFDDPLTPTVEGGVVTGLAFSTDRVSDISPVRALAGLQVLRCNGSGKSKGQLADLAPLRGLKLTVLECKDTRVADLSPLKDMPLTTLWCTNSRVADLTPLKDMKLTDLQIHGTQVTDLSPLKGMPLKVLTLGRTAVSDLSPLKDMRLRVLHCGATAIRDLSPLKGMPLEDVWCNGSKVADLSPLKGMPLRVLAADVGPVRDAEFLRSLDTLETVNGKPTAEFWKEVDKK